jgi:hypothetical protein
LGWFLNVFDLQYDSSLTVSSTYANILKYHIQGMPTNKFGNAGLKSEIYKETKVLNSYCRKITIIITDS